MILCGDKVNLNADYFSDPRNKTFYDMERGMCTVTYACGSVSHYDVIGGGVIKNLSLFHLPFLLQV
jgi:hypothetical protein